MNCIIARWRGGGTVQWSVVAYYGEAILRQMFTESVSWHTSIASIARSCYCCCTPSCAPRPALQSLTSVDFALVRSSYCPTVDCSHTAVLCGLANADRCIGSMIQLTHPLSCVCVVCSREGSLTSVRPLLIASTQRSDLHTHCLDVN